MKITQNILPYKWLFQFSFLDITALLREGKPYLQFDLQTIQITKNIFDVHHFCT